MLYKNVVFIYLFIDYLIYLIYNGRKGGAGRETVFIDDDWFD